VGIIAVVGPQEEPQLWQLGRCLLLQGFVTALVVGVGGTKIPTLTRGETAGTTPLVRSRRGPQSIAALVFLASFPVEIYVDQRAGFALRALVAGGVLVAVPRLWRPPTIPGLHRRLIWLSAWLLPAGYALAAADPGLRSPALHVVFIGSFTVMALSVSLHVALSHRRAPGAPRGLAAAGVGHGSAPRRCGHVSPVRRNRRGAPQAVARLCGLVLPLGNGRLGMAGGAGDLCCRR